MRRYALGASTTNFTQYFNIPSGSELQPALDGSNLSGSQPEDLLSGDATTPNLWAGQGWKSATPDPAATIVRRIASELEVALAG